MKTMTRAEAICAANNILDLAEELNDKHTESGRFPQKYYESVTNQAQSMKERITMNTRYAHITQNMDTWFRNTWAGLRRWDHDDEFNDTLFYGLVDVIEDLFEEESAKGASTGVGASTKKQKGRESEDEALRIDATAFIKGLKKTGLDDRIEAYWESLGYTSKKPAPKEEDIVRLRENCISVVLSQLIRKNIRLIDKDTIYRGDIERILKKTTSDRTYQLLWSAFYAGKIIGIHDLASEIITALSVTKK